MNDFFDTLERQLVEATPHRAARVRRARLQRAAAVASILVVLLVGGAGIAAAVGGGGGDGAGAPAGGGAPAGRTATTAPPSTVRTLPNAPEPGTYTVAVLNGTAIPGLGRGVAMRLQDFGVKIGNVTNAPAQDVTTTTVYYRAADCIPAASQVAEILRLGDARGEFNLMKITKAQRVLAGKNADVVVVAGSDRNGVSGP